MTLCEQVAELLAEHGFNNALLEQYPDLAAHATDCADCQRSLHSAQQLQQALAGLPEHDAPTTLLQRTLGAVDQSRKTAAISTNVRQRQQRRRERRWAVALGGIAVSLAAVALLPLLMPTLQRELTQPDWSTFSDAQITGKIAARDRIVPASAPAVLLPQDTETTTAEAKAELEESQLIRSQNQPVPMMTPMPAPAPSLSSADANAIATVEADVADLAPAFENRQAAAGLAQSLGSETGGRYLKKRENKAKQDQAATSTPLASPQAEALAELAADSAGEGLSEQPLPLDVQAALRKDRQTPLRRDTVSDEKEQRRAPAAKPARSPSLSASLPSPPLPPPDVDNWLLQRESLTGLRTQPPRGYWANTYLADSPQQHQLQSQLDSWDRSALVAAGLNPSLERRAVPYRQPFDAPQNAALALNLHADRAAVNGPSRLRLQIGIKGALRGGGRRPAMQISVIIDQRHIDRSDTEQQTRLRALLSALAAAQQADDRFSLLATGPGGGLLLGPKQFRHGPLSVTLDKLATTPMPSSPAEVHLAQAMQLAGEQIRSDDDALFGSGLVLLVTNGMNANTATELQPVVHQNAVDGVHFSAVTLAANATTTATEPLRRLVLSGQGSLRRLATPTAAAAEALVDRELHAASRAVARALRLRIRLAPGVQLLQVIGSRRLDQQQVRQAREQEQSIDRRVARTIGIRADRGENDEGIQILIPQFAAADEHVILLDLVTDRPGPVVDASLRYKDLLYLRNGNTSASLSLAAGATASLADLGPLQRNVVKNHLALLLVQRVRQASHWLTVGEPQQATALLQQSQQLWQSIRQQLPAWRGDPELLNDEYLLNDYLTALRATGSAQSRQLAASLRAVAYRKLATPTQRSETTPSAEVRP